MNCFNGNSNSLNKGTFDRPPSLSNKCSCCYLNSVFQGLSACNTFVEDINDLSDLDTNKDLEKLQNFKTLINILKKSSESKIDISKYNIFKEWKKHGQQDSYEILAHVLNMVFTELKNQEDKTGEISLKEENRWLKEKVPMRFIFQCEFLCGCQKRTWSPMQAELALHITILISEKKCELSHLLDSYFAESLVEDYICDSEGCDGKGCRKSIKLRKPSPRTLCVHLQRRDWDGHKMVIRNNKIKFQTKLTIKADFWFDAGKEMPTCENKEKKDEIYNLVSVVEHASHLFGRGHYVCYKKVDNHWFLTNDSKVTKVDLKSVLHCNPYILFYEQFSE